MRLLQFLYDHPGAAYDAASGLLIIKEPEPMTLRDPTPNESPLCRYWRELNEELAKLGKPQATFIEAREAFNDGVGTRPAAEVAAQLDTQPRAPELLPARVPTHLNGFPVVAAVPAYDEVACVCVCRRPDDHPHPFAIWTAYQNGGGWHAEAGDYVHTLPEALHCMLDRGGLSRLTPDRTEAAHMFECARSEGDVYPELCAMGAAILPDSRWNDFAREYARRLLRERRIERWPSALTVGAFAFALRDHFIEHAAELARLAKEG